MKRFEVNRGMRSIWLPETKDHLGRTTLCSWNADCDCGVFFEMTPKQLRRLRDWIDAWLNEKHWERKGLRREK